jgi:hypothetical protein
MRQRIWTHGRKRASARRAAQLRWQYEARRMGKRHPNPRLVKLHRSYAVEQIARLFDVHKNTVRAWVKQGLQPIDGQRPALFHGPVLVAFLQRRRESAKQPCPPGHIYCLPCRAPKAPAGNMAEFVPVTDTTGNLRGICPDCDRLIHRRVNQAKIEAIQGNLEITFADAPPRIRERITPSVNCDSGKEG